MRQKRTLIMGLPAIFLLAGIAFAGCSGLDDLQVHSDYPFTVNLRYDGGEAIGSVAPHSSATFARAAGYKGSRLDQIQYETTQGKLLGRLNADQPNIQRKTREQF